MGDTENGNTKHLDDLGGIRTKLEKVRPQFNANKREIK